MTDILIRNIPEDTLNRIDTMARKQKLSRSEYLRRYLDHIAGVETLTASMDDLRRAATAAQDLLDPQTKDRAWQ